MTGSYIGQNTNGVLPNITGRLGMNIGYYSPSGSFYVITDAINIPVATYEGRSIYDTGFNASRSSPIYGQGWFDGTKVVPASVGMYYIIKY